MSDKSDVQLITELIMLYLEGRITADQEDKLDTMFAMGKGISKQLIEQARAGAKHDHPFYQALFGQMQRWGWGIANNKEEAVRLFRLSHEQGCANGTYAYSRYLLSGCGVALDKEKTVRLLRAARYAQEARVTYKLAWCHYYGQGVEENEEEAARLFLEAAHLGYSHAMYMAGDCFRDGRGVERNVVEAARWFRRAAALGQGDALVCLERIQRWDAEAVNPYGDWRVPVGIASRARAKEIHRWVSDTVHREMVAALLVCKRIGIPRGVAIQHLLPFICSLPRW